MHKFLQFFFHLPNLGYIYLILFLSNLFLQCSKTDESNKRLTQYQEEISTYNQRIDECEDTINNLLEKIVDLKEENFDYKEKLEELEKLKLRVEDSNNVIGDYEEKLAELEKIKRDLSACNDELIKSKETIKILLNETKTS